MRSRRVAESQGRPLSPTLSLGSKSLGTHEQSPLAAPRPSRKNPERMHGERSNATVGTWLGGLGQARPIFFLLFGRLLVVSPLCRAGTYTTHCPHTGHSTLSRRGWSDRNFTNYPLGGRSSTSPRLHTPTTCRNCSGLAGSVVSGIRASQTVREYVSQSCSGRASRRGGVGKLIHLAFTS